MSKLSSLVNNSTNLVDPDVNLNESTLHLGMGEMSWTGMLFTEGCNGDYCRRRNFAAGIECTIPGQAKPIEIGMRIESQSWTGKFSFRECKQTGCQAATNFIRTDRTAD